MRIHKNMFNIYNIVGLSFYRRGIPRGGWKNEQLSPKGQPPGVFSFLHKTVTDLPVPLPFDA